MPALVPFAIGVFIGVCVAPTVRKQAHLKPVFIVADAVQETMKDVGRRGWQVLKDLSTPTCCHATTT